MLYYSVLLNCSFCVYLGFETMVCFGAKKSNTYVRSPVASSISIIVFRGVAHSATLQNLHLGASQELL